MKSFIAHVKLKEIYSDPAGDIKKRFDTFNYEVKRPFPIAKKPKKDRADNR